VVRVTEIFFPKKKKLDAANTIKPSLPSLKEQLIKLERFFFLKDNFFKSGANVVKLFCPLIKNFHNKLEGLSLDS
jgi:hypothetical protein